MNKCYQLIIVFLFFAFQSYSQQRASLDCNQFCEVEKTVGEGVFLGVQIVSCPTANGTRIVSVVEDTQAEKMGLQKGDIVQAINGVQMTGDKMMVKWVGSKQAELPVEIDILRDNKQQTIAGKLGYKTVSTVIEKVCCDDVSTQLPIRNVKVFPNPSTGDFSFSFDGKTNKPYQLRIVDMKGNVAFENTIQPNGKRVNEQIQFAVPAAGDYIVLVSQNGKTYQKKVVFLNQ